MVDLVRLETRIAQRRFYARILDGLIGAGVLAMVLFAIGEIFTFIH